VPEAWGLTQSAALASLARPRLWSSTFSPSGSKRPGSSALTDVIDSTTTKPVEAVRDLLHGGADHVFDFVGLKAVAEQARHIGVGGGLYLVGVSKPEVSIDLNIFDAIGGQKRVQGVNSVRPTSNATIPMYADLYLQGHMNLDALVSEKDCVARSQ